MNALEFTDVTAAYGEYRALLGLSLTVGERELVAVLGRNGVGKSTMMRVASGLVPLTGGRGTVLGRPLRRASTARLAKLGVVHLPEGVGLFVKLSIEDNLRLRVGGRNKAERRERLDQALEAIGPLRERRRSKAGELSGGQQRLVAIAGALAAAPRLLLADEPALGLSPVMAEEVYGALGGLKDRATAAVIVETRLDRVQQLCPRAVVMELGRAVFDGPIDQAAGIMAAQLQRRPRRAVDVPFDLPGMTAPAGRPGHVTGHP